MNTHTQFCVCVCVCEREKECVLELKFISVRILMRLDVMGGFINEMSALAPVTSCLPVW